MRRSIGVLLGVCALLGCSAVTGVAQEWTRFRGPNGQGVSEATTIPVSWTEDDYNWKTPLPGLGHSSPVVWDNKVFLLSADPDDATRYVICINADSGDIVWTRSYESQPHRLHARSSFASCTPAVDEKHVYVAWSTPQQTLLKALTHDGQEAWSLDLGPWTSQWGFGTSPMLYEDMVILFNSQQAHQLFEGEEPGDSYMMAFDRETGKEIWRTPRTSVQVCYSVPVIYTSPDGRDQLICTSTAEGFFSLDPKTGEENWSVDAFSMRVVSSPVLAGGLVFGSTGSGGGGNYVAAARLDGNPELAYEVRNQAPYVPTMVARDELIFLWSDGGVVSCLDAPTGEVYWRQRVGGNFSGSPIRVRDKLYCIDEDGVVVVLRADKDFELLAHNPLGEPSRATPAVSGGRMYLRTYSHLISVGGQSP
jgi:outer membrane protein assembly factor BamB